MISVKRHFTSLHIIGLIILLFFVAKGFQFFINRDGRSAVSHTGANSSLQLISPAFSEGQPIPAQYTCKGQDISPPLSITGVPSGAKSLAIIAHDPDAVGGDFTHWLVWDMPAQDLSLTAGDTPVGSVQGANDSGNSGYMGPCPPAGTGTHHYQFELYALNATLNLKPDTNRHQLQQAIGDHLLDRTILTGTFSANN